MALATLMGSQDLEIRSGGQFSHLVKSDAENPNFVKSEAVPVMSKLVAPNGVLYLINDTGPDQADVEALTRLRPDLPPLKNLYQLLGWTQAPHNGRSKAGDWQLLHNVKWAERDGEYIPLVGSAANALEILNKHGGTSHIMSSTFRSMMSGHRVFDGGWRRVPDEELPALALSLGDGDSLVGLQYRLGRLCAPVHAAVHAADNGAVAGLVPPQPGADRAPARADEPGTR